jgi:hypothetical protein
MLRSVPLILVHVAAVWALIGLIWTIQLVHYPLFAAVSPNDAAGFAAYEQRHAARMTLLVAPLMLIELVTTVLLVWLRPSGVHAGLLWLGLAAVAVVWLSTWLLQVPMHARLADGFDAEAHVLLVQTNWIRTVAWTTHGIVALAIVYQSMLPR